MNCSVLWAWTKIFPIIKPTDMKNSLLLTLIVTLISALSLSAQIPDPIVYFDFEGDSGDQVVDKGTNGNNGTINGSIYSTDVPEQNCYNNSDVEINNIDSFKQNRA